MKVVISGDLKLLQTIDGDMNLSNSINGQFGTFYEVSPETHETYAGAYEVTPSSETQVLNTEDKIVLESITINPIPQNYGLIGWNGSILTVS